MGGRQHETARRLWHVHGAGHGERRRHLRWLAWGAEGQITPNREVSFLNISQGGTPIEHLRQVRAGIVLLLTLLLPQHEITLRCPVIRSLVHGNEVWPSGKQVHVYHTGLEFLEVSEESQRLIDECIDSLRVER